MTRYHVTLKFELDRQDNGVHEITFQTYANTAIDANTLAYDMLRTLWGAGDNILPEVKSISVYSL